MHADDPDMLLTFDGKLAYVGVDALGRFYVKSLYVISSHATLTDALIAAAVKIGAVP